MQDLQNKEKKSIEKQLNRIVVLLRNGPSPEEENKICLVLGNLASYSEIKNLTISVGILQRNCEICDRSLVDRDFKVFTFRCGHVICSTDCLAEYLSEVRVCEQMTCARKSCEIKSPKAEFLQGEEESSFNDYTVKCLICDETFGVENSVKLPCSHRFCSMCILSFIRSQDFTEFGNGCPNCLARIPKKTLNRIQNPEFEVNLRALLNLN